MASSTDLNALFFEHKILPKILGEPTFDKLHQLLRWMKANACSVPCTLGGGANGYVGMLVSNVSYATLAPRTPFIVPVHPGVLQVPPNSTQYQIALAKSQHDESVRVYREYTLMQRALISQLVSSIDEIYLSGMRNRITGQLPGDIRAIMLNLFAIYGKIRPEYILERKTEVETLTFNLSDPIDTIWNKIEDLAELAELALRPFSDQQLTDFAFIIINKQRAFRDDVRQWMRLNPIQQTYAALKLHFSAAHTELRATDATVDELGYHSANAMVTQIVEQLRLAAVVDPQVWPEGPEPLPPQLPPPIQEPAPIANAVVHAPAPAPDPIMVQLLAQMQQMQLQLNLQTNQGNRNQNRGGRGRRGDRNQNGNRGNPQRGRRQYCWTHGSCAHSGADCETTSEGHIPTATFANKQGGSTRNC